MTDIRGFVDRQIRRWNIERQALERRQEEVADTAVRPPDLRPVLTLSRQHGSRGRELAKVLSHELKLGAFDRQVIEFISRDGGVKSSVVKALDEQERSNLEVWVEGMLSQRIFDSDDYIHGLGEVIRSASMHGGILIVGRGANFFLSESQAYRVRIVASESVRIHNLVQAGGMSELKAREDLHRIDDERSRFVKNYFKKDIDDPTVYDLVLNIGMHTLEEAVKVILSGVRARGWPVEHTGGDKRSVRLRPAG